jgi:hypothetical protein
LTFVNLVYGTNGGARGKSEGFCLIIGYCGRFCENAERLIEKKEAALSSAASSKLSTRQTFYSARSRLIVSSIFRPVSTEKPMYFSATIPFLLMMKMVGMERSPYSVCNSSPTWATG